jgi:hypothetical protein
MRSALSKFLLLFIVSAAAYGQVNPHTNIRWPANCRTGEGKIYNWVTNQCQDLNAINPGTQMTWPPSCTAGKVYDVPSNSCIYSMTNINPGTQLTWPTNCNNGNMIYSPFTQSCIANGTANNPAGSATQVQFNLGGVFGADAAFTYNNSTQALGVGALVSGKSPMADIRAFGGAANGSDIGPALISAINSCNTAISSSCQVLLPCTGPNGCYLDNGSSLPAVVGGKTVEINLQGFLSLGSTLQAPNYMTWIAHGGAGPISWQTKNATATIYGPNVKGSMGTAITTTGSAVTFTPTYTAGSASNFHVGSAITIAGVQTCTASATRDSTIGSNLPNTVFTVVSCADANGNAEGIRIPVQAVITVSGCSDTTFNGVGLPVNAQDWPAAAISIHQSGATASTTGCTVVGFDDNTYESVRITAVSGGTMTATFAHPHGASDLWGQVGVVTTINGASAGIKFDLQGIAIQNAWGLQLWMDNEAQINLEGVGVSARQYLPSAAVECAGCWWGQWRSVQFLAAAPNINCTSNCTAGYPYGLRCTQSAYHVNGVGIGCGNFGMYDMTIAGGIKIDGNGMVNATGSGIDLSSITNLIVERPSGAAIMADPRYSFGGELAIHTASSFTLSDNFLGNTNIYVGGTDCCVTGIANLGGLNSYSNAILKNKYWGPQIVSANSGTIQTQAPNSGGTDIFPYTGLLSNGYALTGYLRDAGTQFSPSLIPFNTLPTLAITCATCSTVTGPDLVANSATEVKNNGTTTVSVTVGSQNIATYPGDKFIFGSWTNPGTGMNGRRPNGFFGLGGLYWINSATDLFYESGGQAAGHAVAAGPAMNLTYDSWSTGIAQATIAAGSGSATPHTVTLSLSSPGSAINNAGNQYFSPFWLFVPGPNNPAYNGVLAQEVSRWVQDLYKGYVPSGLTAPYLAADPNLKTWWGNDTNLYRESTGGLATDQTLHVGGGLRSDAISTTPSTAAVCANGTNGTLTTYGCPGTPASSTLIGDNFQRAAGPLGSNWATFSGGTLRLAIASPGLVSATGGSSSVWDYAWYTGATFATAQCAQFQINTVVPTSAGAGLYLSLNTTDYNNQYQVLIQNRVSSSTYQILKILAGASTNLTANTSYTGGTMAPGDVYTFCNTGGVTNNLITYRNGVAGSATGSDTALTNGYPGFIMQQTLATQIKNWVATGVTTGNIISLGGSALAVGCTTQTPVTITAAYPITHTMACVMSGVGGNPANIEPHCSVTGLNTVTPYLCTAVAGTPAAQMYTIRVVP